jgi:hypothetical protein
MRCEALGPETIVKRRISGHLAAAIYPYATNAPEVKHIQRHRADRSCKHCIGRPVGTRKTGTHTKHNKLEMQLEKTWKSGKTKECDLKRQMGRDLEPLKPK